MPNKYYQGYKNLSRSNLFSMGKIITQEGTRYQRDYHVLKVNVNNDMIQHTLEIAEEKSSYTMDKDQAEKIRTFEEKKLSAFRGVLAETASQILLERCLKLSTIDIKRFDIERSTFAYSPEEYDIKILYKNNSYEIEIRSSENYKYNLRDGLEKLDIIGIYTNDTKLEEEPAHFYIRPLYQYNPLIFKQERNLESYLRKIKRGEITLYLTAGTDRKSMERYSRIKQMGQNKTEFRCLWMQHPTAKDILQFINHLRGIF